MDTSLLQNVMIEFKLELEMAITSSCFNGEKKRNGQIAKEALIRSQKLINLVHEAVKSSLTSKLESLNITNYELHPPINAASPELKITGLLKAKDQDIVLLFQNQQPEKIKFGPLAGQTDKVGLNATQSSIIIGVRSQMSSVEKNFDTLMERAFAETLNLRLRSNKITMGEVYVLPIFEYDDKAMRQNNIEFKERSIKIEKFIKTFLSISNRKPNFELNDIHNLYKYDRTALVLVDFRSSKPSIFLSEKSLVDAGLLNVNDELGFDLISPKNFVSDLIQIYIERFKL